MAASRSSNEKTGAEKSGATSETSGSGSWKAMGSCVFYSVASVAMMLSNKALTAAFDVDLEVTLVVFQCLVALVLVELARKMGQVEYEAYDWKLALRWLPVNIFFCAMLFTGFMALKWMSVPMVIVFKKMTNLFIVVGDWRLNRQRVSFLIMASLLVMIIGAFQAAANDISFNAWGYFWMMANCIASAGYVLYMKHATANIKLPKFGMVFYNNLLGLILLLPVALAKGEFRVLLETSSLHTPQYAMLNVFAGTLGFLLNFASLWCVDATSATTFSIVGAMNKVSASVVGWFIFQTPVSPAMVQYMSISILGGILYSLAKIRESRVEKRRQQQEQKQQQQQQEEQQVPTSPTARTRLLEDDIEQPRTSSGRLLPFSGNIEQPRTSSGRLLPFSGKSVPSSPTSANVRAPQFTVSSQKPTQLAEQELP